MKRGSASLGQAELEILRFVNDHHPISVGQVAAHIAQTTGKARTTVLTVMERLRKKGYLTRRKMRGVYQYSPNVPQGDLLRDIVGKFVTDTLDGSISPFLAYIASSQELEDAELVQLKQLVRELEKKKREESP